LYCRIGTGCGFNVLLIFGFTGGFSPPKTPLNPLAVGLGGRRELKERKARRGRGYRTKRWVLITFFISAYLKSKNPSDFCGRALSVSSFSITPLHASYN
jgi:hypothetical protein